jgi:hypothetical protein
MTSAKKTKNHETIRKWIEERGGRPATVAATAKEEEAGLLRIDFPAYSGGETLESLEWRDFFDKFYKNDLTFLYQDKTETGETSRFYKFVSNIE